MKIKLFGGASIVALLVTASFVSVLAQSPAATPSPSPSPVVSVVPSKSPKPVRHADLACMQTAVEKRDNAVIAGVDAYHASVVAALQTRRDALKAGWGISDAAQRKAALKAAWDAFNGTWKKAGKALRQSRIAAWKQFRADSKACAGGSSVAGEPEGGEGHDAQL